VECSAAIGRYGGEVARYFGDGVMAFFGWPVHMRMTPLVLFTPSLERLCPEYEDFRASYPELSSGVCSGPVVVGEIGTSGTWSMDAVGEDAEYRCTSTDPCRCPTLVLISESTRASCMGSF